MTDFRFSSNRPRSPRHRREGSVLIVALLITALIALALGSYINLNLTSSRLAQRSFRGYAGMNLAEAGVEEGVWAVNRAAAGDRAAWNAWTQSSGAAWQKFPNFEFTPSTTGSVKVYVDQFDPPVGVQPKVIAFSQIERGGEAPVLKMIEVTLRRRSFFANGLVAKNRLVFNGNNTSVDSWNSDPDRDPVTPPVEYNPAIRVDRGSIASGSAAINAMMVNHAQVWGYAFTGGSLPQLHSDGTIRGGSTRVGVAVDSSRIATDFNAEFPTIPMPTDGESLVSIGSTLGTLGTSTRWRCPNLALSGTQTLTIYGDVTLIITAPARTRGVSVTGQASIIIPGGSSLTLYLESDVLIAGAGLANENVQPATCKIWGTNRIPGDQDFHVAGNGALKSAIYAPNADIKVNGNGEVMGSIVAQNITLTGNAAFHFDEALAESSAGTPFGIGKWRELTSSEERAPYMNLFSGW